MKRYGVYSHHDGTEAIEEKYGDYVKYEDARALEAELDQLQGIVKAAKEVFDSLYYDDYVDLVAGPMPLERLAQAFFEYEKVKGEESK